MTSSDDFKRALKAGKLTEALTLAMGKIIELNIVTTVVDSEDQSHPWQQVKVKPGYRMQTHIDLVQGDITNEIGEQFLSGGTYEELRKFHQQQVVQGNVTIQENVESLQKLLSIWLRVNQVYSNPHHQFYYSLSKALATEADLDYSIEQEARQEFPSLPTTTEKRTEVPVISGTKPEKVKDFSTVENLKQSDEFDGWDEAIFDLLSSFPDTPEPEIDSDLAEIAPQEEEIITLDSFPPTPKPEMPVADLEVEDWEIAAQEHNGTNQAQPQLQIVSLEDFTIESEPEDITQPTSQEEEIQTALDVSSEVSIPDEGSNEKQAAPEAQSSSLSHDNHPISQEPLESLSNIHNQLIQQNGESTLDALERGTWFEDDWGEVPVEEEGNSTSDGNSSTPGDGDVQDSPSEASFVETRVVDDELGFLFEDEDLASYDSTSSPQLQNEDTVPSRWDLEEDELSAVFEDDLFGSLPIRAKRQDNLPDRTKEQDSD